MICPDLRRMSEEHVEKVRKHLEGCTVCTIREGKLPDERMQHELETEDNRFRFSGKKNVKSSVEVIKAFYWRAYYYLFTHVFDEAKKKYSLWQLLKLPYQS